MPASTPNAIAILTGVLAAALFGVALALPATAAPSDATDKVAAAPSADSGRVVKNQYLVETVGTPVVRGGSRLANSASQKRVETLAAATGATVLSTHTRLWTGLAVRADEDQVRTLARSPGVRAVYPVLRESLPTTLRGGVAATGALAEIAATGTGSTGAGVKVGIIDTGVDYHNADLGGSGQAGAGTFPTARVAYGYDFVGDDFDPDVAQLSQPVPDSDPDDCGSGDASGHGTHVAGIVGADGDPASGGAVGVAPGVTLGAYRVFGCGDATTSAVIIAAMERAAADGMDVVNLSLGSSFDSWPGYPEATAARNLVAMGVVVVAAVGNNGTSGLFAAGTPAVGPGVISVAAFAGDTGTIAAFSSTGVAADLSLVPTISAPGVNIYSTCPVELGSHTTMSGTSMASPHVAGGVALLLQAKPSLKRSPNLVAQALYNTAIVTGTRQPGVTGHPEAVFRQGSGLLQVQGAIDAGVAAWPATLRLGEGTQHKVSVTLTNSTSKTLAYTASGVSGVSAAASTSASRNPSVGTTTPRYGYRAIGFKVHSPRFTLAPGQSARVVVRITAPVRVLKGKPGMLYGGWLRFTTADNSHQVSVPFVGLRGDYQKVKLLNRFEYTDDFGRAHRSPAFGSLAGGTIEYLGSKGRAFDLRSRFPMIAYHLDYPAQDLRVKVTNTRTRTPYYAIIKPTAGTPRQATHLGHQPRDDSYQVIGVGGLVMTSKGRVVALAAGRYRLQLRVLKPLGRSSGSSHWETWTSPKFSVQADRRD